MNYAKGDCLLTIIKTSQDYRSIASTIDVIFYQVDNPETDYIKIVQHEKENIIFFKKNYNQITSIVNTANERINLIADCLQNQVETPTQGMLFE